jgi:hypothetical protein
VIRILAIVVISFAAGVLAGYFLATAITSNDGALSARKGFFKPAPAADLQDAQEMKPRW